MRGPATKWNLRGVNIDFGYGDRWLQYVRGMEIKGSSGETDSTALLVQHPLK